MSDHTPSLDEVLSEALMEVYDNGTNPNALREARAVIARIGDSAWAEAVRAEEREKADREPSDAAVEAAARAMAHADVTNPDGWVMTEEARNVYSDMARAALIAAQEVRDES